VPGTFPDILLSVTVGAPLSVMSILLPANVFALIVPLLKDILIGVKSVLPEKELKDAGVAGPNPDVSIEILLKFFINHYYIFHRFLVLDNKKKILHIDPIYLR
jgi:hypothetical protein